MINTPAPVVVQPSLWAGNDGNWSTFLLGVGSPAQYFGVLPSVLSSEVWIPVPEGCTWIPSSVLPNCGATRGALDSGSLGFQTNRSTTWSQIGLQYLGTGQNLYGPTTQAGLFGFDTVSFGPDLAGYRIPDQLIAGIATQDYWLGSLGLATNPSGFETVVENVSSLVPSVKQANDSPSLSFGYAAGASYRSDVGSLILGGYDESAFEPSGLAFPINSDVNHALSVMVESIVVTGTLAGVNGALAGTASVPVGSGLNMTIDSSTSQLWLPRTVCDFLEESFGLQYDRASGLYTVNNTIHSRLLQSNPQFTFTIAPNSSSTASTNIILPYAAFDLQATIPIFNTSTNYFPIRRAANESQFVLGRTFLQEAYLVVDWELGNFTLGQAVHEKAKPRVVPIVHRQQDPKATSGLSAGTIAGIVIGVLVVLAAIVLAIWYFRRRKQKQSRLTEAGTTEKIEEPLEWDEDKKGPAELFQDDKKAPTELWHESTHPSEAQSQELLELHGHSTKQMLMSTQLYELDAGTAGQELQASTDRPRTGR
ncbi:uncharacterized protein LTR77_006948 [Saxophila tyrrhenica]|uniref:Peptidase A1 domain-containing protein n=1 Tax=Saxophila tyrrhenica TaxID=1690608 RepID=A0AAV9P6S5_9PEZI|nr:hypothetical protein LTR77_006948 [Saxophila tyrrhenica]